MTSTATSSATSTATSTAKSTAWSSIWYRHWLEIRGGLLVGGILTALLCLAYPLIVFGHVSDYKTGAVTAVGNFRAMLDVLGADRFVSWRIHALLCTIVVAIFGILALGAGLAPWHPSRYFTLTLPVSRFTLVWTRFAAECAVTGVLLAAMLILNSGFLLVIGRPVPLGAMALFSLLAILVVAAVLAVSGALTLLMNERQVAWALVPEFFIIIFAVRWAWGDAPGYLAGPGLPWRGIGWIVLVIDLIIGAALSVSAAAARRKDF